MLAGAAACSQGAGDDEDAPAHCDPQPATVQADRGAPLSLAGELYVDRSTFSARPSLQWSRDDSELFYVSADRAAVRALRVSDGARRTLATGSSFGGLALDRFTGALYVDVDDGAAPTLLEVDSGQTIPLPARAAALVFSPDGRFIASPAGTVQLFERATGKARALPCDPSWGQAGAFTPDSSGFVCLQQGHSTYVQLDLAGGAAQALPRFPSVELLVTTPSGVLGVGEYGGFTLHTTDGAQIGQMTAHGFSSALTLSDDGGAASMVEPSCVEVTAQCLCVRSEQLIWTGRFADGAERRVATGLDDADASAVLSHDGKQVAYVLSGTLYVRPGL